ncbi:Hypothetical predicted protein [Paramuricea clavata]|uniref:Uncharacterized protein n=1 Tax=Paramuricea clavata TaxID=317549 RepID=A0A6S7I8G0_PARCT|nr:Hypothetical predicted protein [Paramuricea clavata]CAB4032759.1 Hypothetical predicted protein [Paramuricea clavata]
MALPKSPRRRKAVHRKLYESELDGSSISSSTDSPKRSDALSDELVELVKTFYQRDDISRQAPGRKDVINVRDKNGQKVSYQTRHLTSSVMETYALFCKEYPNKIGKSKFAELRPKHVLLSSKLPHNVCLCKYHENFINAVNILHQVSPSVPLYTNEFPQSCLCNPVKRECWMNQCEQCKDGKGFRNSYPLEENDDVKWYVWKTDSSNKLVKNVEEGTTEELYTHICSIIPQFMAHCFTKRMQAEAYNKERKDAEADSESLSNAAFLQVDFSENYTCVSQDEIQSAHWKQSQVSLFTAALWYSGILHPIVIASDNLNHSKDTIVAYIDYLLSILPSNTQNISIWSDGPSSQFKNRFIVAALKSLQDKHKIQITWNYFATSHGKGPVDGIGGAVKRQVWMTVKTRKHIVCDAKSFVVAAEDSSNVKVVEMATSEIEERNTSLNTKEVFEDASPIPGIAAIHSIKIDNAGKIVGRALVEEETDMPRCGDEGSNASVNEELCQIEVGDWYTVEYEGKIYPGEVKYVTADDIQVSVMVRAGKYWKWPTIPDEIFYQQDKFVRKLNAPVVVNSRGHFQFSDF